MLLNTDVCVCVIQCDTRTEYHEALRGSRTQEAKQELKNCFIAGDVPKSQKYKKQKAGAKMPKCENQGGHDSRKHSAKKTEQ